MKKVLRALVMDDGTQLAHQLRELIYPAFEVGAFQIIYTAHEGLEALINEEYNICLLPEGFSTEAASSLMSDYSKLEKELECDFIQVRESLPDNFNRSSLKAQGFASVISRQITNEDVRAIEDTLKHQVRAETIVNKSNNVKENLGLMLADLDRAAADRKRGCEKPLRSVSRDFISSETAFDEKVLKKYFNALSDESSKREPPGPTSISVPAQVLKKRAPHLSSDRYTGVSRRVWEKLLRVYGTLKKPGSPGAVKAQDGSPDAQPAEADVKDESES